MNYIKHCDKETQPIPGIYALAGRSKLLFPYTVFFSL